MGAGLWQTVGGALYRSLQSACRTLIGSGSHTMSDAQLRTLADILPHIVWLSDPQGAIHYVNARWRDYTGSRDVPSSAWEAVVHPDDLAAATQARTQASQDGSYYQIEYRLRAADGSYRWFVARATPIKDMGGTVIRFFGTLTDIDRQKVAEFAHRDSEQRLRSLVEVTSSIVYSLTPAGHFAAPQTSWQRYTGQSWEQYRGEGWTLALHPEDRRRIYAQFLQAASARSVFTCEGRLWHSASNNYRHFNSKATPIFAHGASPEADPNAEPVAWLGMITDVHEQREHQDYQERLLGVIESSTEFVGLATAEGKMIYLNEAGRRMVGVRNLAEVSQKDMLDFFMPVDQPFVENTVLPEVMMHGRWRGEYRMRNLQSGETLPVHYNVFATLGEDESFLGFGSISRDITEELRSQKILQAAIAARDDFLSIASHELKTPLTALKLQLQLTARNVNVEKNLVPPAVKLQRTLDVASRQVDRLGALVEDLLDVSRIQGGKMMYTFETVEMEGLVREVVSRLQDAYAEAQIPLTVDILQKPNAHCDRFRMEQVLINLLTNALKYGEQKPVVVRLTQRDQYACIAVQDHGMGIDAANLEKIFLRFERALSHHNISGLGLGLYITKQIVDAHRGTIEVTSTLKVGTTFTVLVPLLPPAEDR